ncbi:hypothetical protein MFAL_34490 [Mycolicibacterium fallax]|nr:hypothetical protein MFAL_34490 [Mycolicibacterium fallax]
MDDLAVIYELRGLENLPYPLFGRTPPGQNEGRERDAYWDQLHCGDLKFVQNWITAYINADIWLECQVHYLPPRSGTVRVAACRADQIGFLASQRVDENTVNLYSVPPLQLGSAVATSVGLTAPGTHSLIVAPPFFVDLGPRGTTRTSEIDDGGFKTVPVVSKRPARTTVARADVISMAVAQSRCDPARSWGLDPAQDAVGWVHVAGDGDYIYAPDFSHAVPGTVEILGKRIDRLIAEDIAELRRRRESNW